MKPLTSQPTCTHFPSIPPPPTPVVHSDDHSQVLRHFIGPMPYAIAVPQIRKTRRFLSKIVHGDQAATDGQDDETVSDDLLWRVIQRSKHGSDWDRDMNPSRREDLIRKLKQSVWSGVPEAVRKKKRGTWFRESSVKWVGESFQIGQDILGHSGPVPLTASQPFESQRNSPDDNASLSPSGFSASRQTEGGRPFHTASSVQNGYQASSSSFHYENTDIEAGPHDASTSQFSDGIETHFGRSDSVLLPQPAARTSNFEPVITAKDTGKAEPDVPHQRPSALRPEPQLPMESRKTVRGVNFADEGNYPGSLPEPPADVSRSDGQLPNTRGAGAVSDQVRQASIVEAPMRGSVKASH